MNVECAGTDKYILSFIRAYELYLCDSEYHTGPPSWRMNNAYLFIWTIKKKNEETSVLNMRTAFTCGACVQGESELKTIIIINK